MQSNGKAEGVLHLSLTAVEGRLLLNSPPILLPILLIQHRVPAREIDLDFCFSFAYDIRRVFDLPGYSLPCERRHRVARRVAIRARVAACPALRTFLLTLTLLYFAGLSFGQELSVLDAERARLGLPEHGIDRLRFDIPAAPQDSSLEYLGFWGWGPCYGVAAMGNYVMTGSGPTLLWLDVTDKQRPVVVWDTLTNTLFGFYEVRLFSMQDSLGYAIVGGTKLIIVDFRNPLSPAIIGELQIPASTPILSMVVEGSFIFTKQYLGWLYCIDASNPASPYLRNMVQGWTGLGISNPMTVTNHNLYIGDNNSDIVDYVNVSNPDSITVTPLFNLPPLVTALHARDSLLLLCNSSTSYNLHIYSIATPYAPQLLSRIIVPDIVPTNVTTRGDTAFVGTIYGRIVVVDISDKTNPVIIGTYTPPIADLGIWQLEAVDTVLYCAHTSGLSTLSIANPAPPNVISFFPTGDGSGKVVVQNGLAYISSGLAGLWVVDVSDVARPLRRGNIQTLGSAYGIVVHSDVAYLTVRSYNESGWNGIYAIDVSNPDTLRLLDTLAMERPYALSKSGSLLFVTRGDFENPMDTTVTIVNVTNPSNLQPVGHIIGGYNALEITSRDSIAFVAARNAGLKIFDCRNPVNPQLLSSVFPNAVSVAVNEQRAYVHVRRAGLWGVDSVFVLDISDLTAPLILGGIPSYLLAPNSECETIVAGNLLWWAWSENFGAYDVSNPAQPTLAFAESRLLGVRDLGVVGDTLFVPHSTSGMWIFRYNPGPTVVNDENGIVSTFQLLQNYPNPFNPSTVIRYTLSVHSQVSLKVYNLLGQEVATLVNEEQAAGSYATTFDASGLSSGLYFYRLTTPEKSLARKMVILR
jgi:hypothetical protein